MVSFQDAMVTADKTSFPRTEIREYLDSARISRWLFNGGPITGGGGGGGPGLTNALPFALQMDVRNEIIEIIVIS